ncbi:hypothetical protein MMC24_002814 [Lignoscripta atroalba]|nr:hypothetical protein [Lignoscripta atroalba]
MNILITGANGFIGQALAAALLSHPNISQLTLTDIVEPPLPPQAKSNAHTQTRCLQADLTAQETCESLFASSSNNLTHIYLLHGLMSGAAEANLDLGLKINIDSMRLVLDILRRNQHHHQEKVKVIFPSSLAVFGPPPPGDQLVSESTAPLPSSSYGAQKLIVETLLNDYSRRGFLDGRILRLPTIIVRPGKPSGAASSFCSGIVREPLDGQKSELPVSREMQLWVCSARTVVRNLVLAMEIPAERFAGRGSRVVNLPGVTVSVKEMLGALREVGGQEALDRVVDRRDEEVERIVGSWPARLDTSWAKELGFFDDGPLERTVREYVEDYGAELS